MMKRFINKYWKTLLFFALSGLVGGFFVGIFMMDSYPVEIQQQIYEQGITDTILCLVSALQYAGYGLVLGFFGILLGKKIGLWKDETSITKKPLIVSAVVGVAGGLVLILSDLLYFGKYVEAIMNSYAVKPTFAYILGAVICGGVVEEVMLRLFMMSLIAFILHKVFGKKNEKPAVAVLVVANIVAAVLFAAGHLPATAALMGITPMILFRCFLLNGGFGLLFGYLYRKYGLRYSMIAHAGCHVVSKVVWIVFI